ncbi:tetracycline-efflux transporter-like protein [Peziza echinospora]|nr:tetracycline-efflux transporter-like protein [Peziza echinospora]
MVSADEDLGGGQSTSTRRRVTPVPPPTKSLVGSTITAEERISTDQYPNENAPLLVNDEDGEPILPGTDGGELDDDEWKDATWWQKPSIYWLLFPFSLFATAYGGIAVPKLNVILELICRDYLVDRDLLPPGGGTGFTIDPGRECQAPEVQALVSKFALYLSLIAGILGALTAPKLGAYSDRFGRRWVLAISSMGLLSSELTTVLALKYPQTFSVNLLLGGAVIDGLSGSFMLAMAVAHSYAADCSSVADRAVSFGLFQGVLFLGIAVGPALSGILIKTTGNVSSVFYIAMAAHGLFVAYILLILPESLSPARMALAKRKYAHFMNIEEEGLLQDHSGIFLQKIVRMNPLKPLRILYPTGPGSSPRLRLNLMLLAAADALFYGVGMGGVAVIILYAQKTFDWQNYESSMFLSATSSLRVLLLFVILPLGVKGLRVWKEKRAAGQPVNVNVVEDIRHSGADSLDIGLIRFAIFTELFGYLGFALAANGSQFTLAGMLTALGGVGSPTVRSALTKHIPRDKTGQLLGASALLHSLARVIFPTAFGLVYAATVGTFPTTVFACLSSVFLVVAALSWFVVPHVKLHEDIHGNLVDSDHVSQTTLPS